jgi:hypothetical protein
MKVGILLVATVLAASSQNAPSPERVRFDWPVGTAAVVHTDYANEVILDGVRQTRAHLRMTHGMRILADQKGRVMLNAEHRHLESSGEVASALSALISLWIPKTVLNERGEFVRIEEADRTQQLLFDIYEPLANSAAAGAFPAFKEFVLTMTRPDALSRLGASEWIGTLGKWVGIPLDTAPIEGRGSIRVAPGLAAPTTIHQRIVERGPCARAELRPECATFEIRQTLTAEGLTALKDYATKGASDALPGTLRTVEVTDRAKLEIATMLPHEVTIIRTMRQTLEMNGKAITVENVERRAMQYSYVSAQFAALMREATADYLPHLPSGALVIDAREL